LFKKQDNGYGLICQALFESCLFSGKIISATTVDLLKKYQILRKISKKNGITTKKLMKKKKNCNILWIVI